MITARTILVVLAALLLTEVTGGPILQAGTPGPRTKAAQPLQSGEIVTVAMPPEPGLEGFKVYVAEDLQYTIEVPEDATRLLIELVAADVSRDFDLLVRYGQPVEWVDETQNAFDFASYNPFGWEEILIDGDRLQAGTYYLALGTWSPEGGELGLRCLLDAVGFEIAAGEDILTLVPRDDLVAGNDTVAPDGHQLVLPPTPGATSVYVRYEAIDLALDTILLLRYGQPSTLTLAGDEILIVTAGGFQEYCLSGDELQRDQPLYLWLLNDSGGVPAVGTLRVDIDGCHVPLAAGEPVDGVVMAGRTGGPVPPYARQYVITAGDPPPDLAVTVESAGDPANLDLYVRQHLPVEVTAQGEVMADFTAEAITDDPETLTIPCESLVPGDYYVLVRTPGPSPVPYSIVFTSVPCTPPPPTFRRGHANLGQAMNIADAVMILTYLFANGVAPRCMDAADSNDDGAVNIADAVFILIYLFAQGPPPADPFTTCGIDLTDDALTCDCFPLCGTACD
jgi:hypothetical protein